MAKIIQITNAVISIGTDDGGIKEVRSSDINFVPHIGDEVEIFETETKTIISKLEKREDELKGSSINVNVKNYANNLASPQHIANGTKAVNKVVYCLLAFFLGGIGVHKFYGGKIGTGILYLVFSWTFIPVFLSLIDFIVGACKTADSFGMILI